MDLGSGSMKARPSPPKGIEQQQCLLLVPPSPHLLQPAMQVSSPHTAERHTATMCREWPTSTSWGYGSPFAPQGTGAAPQQKKPLRGLSRAWAPSLPEPCCCSCCLPACLPAPGEAALLALPFILLHPELGRSRRLQEGCEAAGGGRQFHHSVPLQILTEGGSPCAGRHHTD